jgi:outer membrane receptor protein involved in Fe transport
VRIGGVAAPSGLVLRTETGAEARTNDDGIVQLQLPPGTQRLTMTLPPGTLPDQTEERTLPPVEMTVGAGGTSSVIMDLDAMGGITSVEFTGQDPSEVPEAPPESTGEPGVILGQVLSGKDNVPIQGVMILVPGLQEEAFTDTSGRFRVEVPSGRQSLSAIHPDFSTQTQRNIQVPPKGAVEVTITLVPTDMPTDDFVITAPRIKGGVADVLDKRRESTAVQDALGAEDIAKTGDGSASSASKRIVGASIVGGQFLFVRGLGGRYSNVRLNGVPLPSTDPDLPGFQLDLFPAGLISSLTISKTFTPDIPGDFAGGSMNIETKAFPEKFTLSFGVSTSYNTETTGRDILASQGGKTDFLGYDDGGRQMPEEVPDVQLATCRVRRGEEPPEGCLTTEDITEISRAFPNSWKRLTQTAYPNLGLSASVGNTFEVGKEGRLGFLLTGGYKHNYEAYRETVTKVATQGTGEDVEVVSQGSLENDVAEQEALIGVLGTVGYSPIPNHEISLVSLLTQNGVDKATVLHGLSEEEGAQIERTNFSYVERQLFFNQLLGEHRDLGDLLSIAWQLNTATIARDQPDTRSVLYQQSTDGDFFYRPDVAAPGERLYSELDETDYGGGLDLSITPLENLVGKVGYMGRVADRRFAARRFRPDAEDSAEAIDARTLPAEEFFAPENAGVFWNMEEATSATDGFLADQQLHAVYGMVQIPVFDWLKATGGVRVELFRHHIEAFTPYRLTEAQMMMEETEEAEGEGSPTSGTGRDTDYLPAAGLIFTISDEMAVRAAYGGTVARAQIKELAPFTSIDYVRRRSIKGNPELERTFIHNFDLRWETFPSPTQVFAVSAFYKSFEDPIESVILDTNGNITFENIRGADNYGLELEARIGLDILSEVMDDFSVISNLAIIRSEVRLSEEQRRSATSPKRALAGQSPYVANLGLGWEPDWIGFSAYCFYNVFGRRISDVGRQGMPDEYEEAFHSLEANVNYEFFDHFNVGVSGSNLMMQKERYTQGGVTTLEVYKGMTFGLSASYKY